MAKALVCKCKKGYASHVDGLCRFCREKNMSRSEAKERGCRHKGDGVSLSEKLR